MFKLAIFPKEMHRFYVILPKLQWPFLGGKIEKLTFKFIQNCKGPQIAETILKKKNELGGM